MKNSDRKHLPGKIFSFVKQLFSGSGKGPSSGETIVTDSSHVQKREEGSSLHFLYVLLFGTGIASALWQHGSAPFTLAVLALLIPAAFFVYIPYKMSNILFRQMLSCGIFFSACIWIVSRLNKQIPFDLALLEGMILSAFAFLVNCTKKDYHYLFFISLFLLIYAGLIPRPLLLFLIPGALLIMLLIFQGERELYLAGNVQKLHFPVKKRLKNFLRTWHLHLLQLLIALPLFVTIFSFIPLQDTGEEGLFEVSFATTRRSVMPQDMRQWLRQDKKTVRDPDAQQTIPGTDPDTAGTSGPKTNATSQTPADEYGMGSSPPGKDLVFTAVLPAKLYHLATVYDIYDGKTWMTSKALKKSRNVSRRGDRTVFAHSISGEYTIEKWVSPNLYAPFRAFDFQYSAPPEAPLHSGKSFLFFRNVKRTSFNARLTNKTYPELPFSYKTHSEILIPLPPAPSHPSGESRNQMPEIHSSIETVFALRAQAEKEKELRLQAAREKARLAREQARKARLEAQKKAEQKRKALAAKKKAEQKRKALAAKKKRTVSGKSPVPQRPAVKKTAAVKKPPIKKAPPKKIIKKIPPKKIVKKAPPKKRIPWDPAWRESLRQEHYLQLPPNLSERVKHLAHNLTRNSRTPYEKAIILRDYLRTNFKYRLYAGKTPADKESVDHFLFELKEGHCEYFAAALTVLARSVGLPARAATGFSPGNYNALTKRFEVYEYHAHAWTQIFIARVGWLTFDAVPPGSIVSETTPAGIGHLRDPFGDEWKITPPELTEHLLQISKEKITEDFRKLEESQKALKAKQQQKTEKSPKKTTIVKKNKKVKKAAKAETPAERIRNFVNDLGRMAGSAAFSLLTTPRGRTLSGAVLLALTALILFSGRIFRWLKKLCLRYKLNRLVRRSEKQSPDAPEKSLLCLYRAVRILLILAAMERKNNQELLAYARECGRLYRKRSRSSRRKKHLPPDGTQEKAAAFTQILSHVFSEFYALEYGSSAAEKTTVQEISGETEELFSLLRELHPQGLFFLEKQLFAHPFSTRKGSCR